MNILDRTVAKRYFHGSITLAVVSGGWTASDRYGQVLLRVNIKFADSICAHRIDIEANTQETVDRDVTVVL